MRRIHLTLIPLVIFASLFVLHSVQRDGADVNHQGRHILGNDRDEPTPPGQNDRPGPAGNGPAGPAGDIDNNYDYIVVGSGPAGCILSHELATKTRKSVLLIEAGQANWDNENWVNWAGWNGGLNDFNNGVAPSVDSRFSYPTFYHADKTVYGARAGIGSGRVLGGGSIVNTAMFVVGGSYVWNKVWPASWSYQKVKPHVQWLTDWVKPYSHPRRTAPQDTWLQAAANLAAKQNAAGVPDFLVNLATPGSTPVEPVGAPNTVSYNDVEGKNSVVAFGSLSMFTSPLNSTYYKRVTGTDLFPETVMNRVTGQGKGALSKLQIVWGASARKINFKVKAGKNVADSVEFVTNDGKSHTVGIKKEVILTAGSFFTPGILQRSGVGNADRLTTIGVPKIVYNNPAVGQNLQNHYGAQQVFVANGNNTDITNFFSVWGGNLPGYANWRGGAFVGWNKLDPNRPVQTTESQRTTQVFLSAGVSGPSALNIADYNLAAAASRSYTISNCFINLASRGTVEIGDPYDPNVLPNIFYQVFPAYTTNASLPLAQNLDAARKVEQNIITALLAYDQAYIHSIEMNAIVAAKGLNFTITGAMPVQSDLVTFNAGLKRMGADWWKKIWSWSQDSNPSADDVAFLKAVNNLIKLAKTSSSRPSHQLGTNVIGQVVDDRLRVFGVSGVRIADLSVAPSEAGGNTAVTSYVIGRRASELIIEDNE